MSRIRTVVAAVACALGLTTSTITMAGPAAAVGYGEGIHDCYDATTTWTLWGDDIEVYFARDSAGNLTILAFTSSALPPTWLTGNTHEGFLPHEFGLIGYGGSSPDPTFTLERHVSTAWYDDAPDETRFATPYSQSFVCQVQSESGFPL